MFFVLAVNERKMEACLCVFWSPGFFAFAPNNSRYFCILFLNFHTLLVESFARLKFKHDSLILVHKIQIVALMIATSVNAVLVKYLSLNLREMKTQPKHILP